MPFVFFLISLLDPEKIQKVKDIYKALDLPGVYAACKEDSYNRTKSLVAEISSRVSPEIFFELLNKAYGRGL